MLKCTLKYLIFAPTCFGPPGPSSVKIHRYKLCSVVAACISGCGVCVLSAVQCVSHAARHEIRTSCTVTAKQM